MTAPAPDSWVTLDDVKAFLRFPADYTGDDAELASALAGALAAIEDIKGHVQLLDIEDEVQPVEYGGVIFTDEKPVASVESVMIIPSSGDPITIPEADPANHVPGWKLVSHGGVIKLPLYGLNRARVGQDALITYAAGLDPVPANYIMAGKELTAHLWRTSQMNDSGGRANLDAEDTEWIRGSAGSGSYALPFKVRELLGIYGGTVKPVMVQ